MDYIVHARRFEDQTFQLAENRTLRVHPVNYLIPARAPADQIGIGELANLSLHGTHARADRAGDLPQIESFVCVPVEEAENSTARLAEKKISDARRFLCSH